MLERGAGEVVGNDVVDLADPWIGEHHRRERFVSRVCAPEERERVATALDLWSLFAAKEAAYKALVKLGFSPGFAHRAIRVERDLRGVCWRSHCLELSVTHDEQHVHALAWTGRGRTPVMDIARAEPEREAARALLCNLVASAIGCHPAELAIVRDPVAGAWDGFGPPRIERCGASIAADVSLSHDGPFVAVAAMIAGRA
jgi:phosphopantetheinyl transferase (holo-ACP synthase)